jgi:hypothetical protein
MPARRLTLLVTLIATAALVVVPSLVDGTSAPTSLGGNTPLGGMPTHENTGPNEPLTGPDITAKQWVNSRDCDHQRVVGDVRIELRTNRPGTWTLNADQCEFSGEIFVSIDGDYPESEYPTITLNRVVVPKGIVAIAGIRMNITQSEIGESVWAPCPNCAGTDWDLRRAMPVKVTDTLFFSEPPRRPDGYHYEALHLMGSATGLSFENVRFMINGPMVTGVQTGAILADADEMTFKDVYFDFNDGPVASHFTAYIGRGPDTEPGSVSITGCRIEMGEASYVYPNGTGNHDSVAASWSGCRDWDTNEALTLEAESG